MESNAEPTGENDNSWRHLSRRGERLVFSSRRKPQR
jgi:hypothetical protein